MPLLFSYGTLRDEKVQLALFGRTLVGRKDQLLGFEQALIRVQDPASRLLAASPIMQS